MQITKEGDNIVVKISVWQDSLDAIGEVIGKVSNVVGIIDGDKQGLAWVIDLGYKDSFDYGDIFLQVDMEKEAFYKLCKELDIECCEYPICAYCGKSIYGAFTMGDKGNKCYNCELNEPKTGTNK